MAEVTQADRVGAYDLMEKIRRVSPRSKDAIIRGEWDHGDEIQAFAAHRIAAIAEGRRQMREEAAAVIQRDVAFSLKVQLIAAIRAIPIGDG